MKSEKNSTRRRAPAVKASHIDEKMLTKERTATQADIACIRALITGHPR